MQCDNIGSSKEILERLNGLSIPIRELILNVIILHTQSQAFRQHTNLRSDVPVPDNAESFSADFAAVTRALHPLTPVCRSRFLRNPAHEHNEFTDDKLCHAPCVGMRCIEHGNTQPLSRFEIHLVRPDAEAADSSKFLRFLQYSLRHLRARPYPEEVVVPDEGGKFVLAIAAGLIVDIGVAVGPQTLQCAVVYTFQKKETDLILRERERSSGHRRIMGRENAT